MTASKFVAALVLDMVFAASVAVLLLLATAVIIRLRGDIDPAAAAVALNLGPILGAAIAWKVAAPHIERLVERRVGESGEEL